MKKLTAVLLCAAMLFTAASCDLSTDETTKKTRDTEQVETEDDKKHEGEETENETETTSQEQIGEESEMTQAAVTGDRVVFSTTDRNGKSYDDSIFADYDLVMINFWEPWCGPCVGEIGDIEKLYETYKDKGLLVIGVYSETTMEDDVDSILSSNNVNYPILRYTSDFDKYQSGYVPTTIFVDKNGNIIDTGVSYQGIDSTLIVGSKTYGEWEALVTRYLST